MVKKVLDEELSRGGYLVFLSFVRVSKKQVEDGRLFLVNKSGADKVDLAGQV